MNSKKFLILFLIIFLLGSLGKAGLAQKNSAVIDFFWGQGCPHCAKEEKFLEKLLEKYPELEIKSYEVYYNSENQKLFQEVAKKYNITQLGVPLTIIGDRYFLGYQNDETTGQEIENYLKIILGKGEKEEAVEKIKIPFFGSIDLSKMSLPVLTVTLGALDGLNPCAMWILLFLIALLINTRSRKRMWLIGGTFIAASGLVYYLILTAWLNLFLAISYVNLTRILIGVFALGLGAWQIKTFIGYKGVCPVTEGSSKFGDRIKNGLKNQAEKIALSPLTLGILGGVILLALGVNLIEFFCSAGLPAIYTRVLTLSQIPTLSYYLYLLLYTFVFMLDDLIILSLAVITLSRIGFTEKYNYWATLIGGLLIFTLGILLIFKPQLLMFAPTP